MPARPFLPLAVAALAVAHVAACGSSSGGPRSSGSGSGGDSGVGSSSGAGGSSGSSGGTGSGGDAGDMGEAGGGDGSGCTGPFALSPPVVVAPTVLGGPTVAWNGGTYGALCPSNPAATFALSLQRLDAHGSLLGGPISVSTSANTIDALLGVGSGFEALWVSPDGNSLDAAGFDANGASTGPAAQLDVPAGGPMAIAWSGSAALVISAATGVLAGSIWSPGSGSMPTVVGFTGGPDDLGWVAPSSAVWAGDHWAIAWRTWSTGSYMTTVYVGEIGTDGTVTNVIPVWSGPDEGDQNCTWGCDRGGASIAWTGKDYRVAWLYPPNELLTAVVQPKASAGMTATAMLNASTLPIQPPLWDGAAFGTLVPSGSSDTNDTFVRFTPAGTMDGAAIPLGFSVSSIIWTGREYALAGTQGGNDVFARIGGCP